VLTLGKKEIGTYAELTEELQKLKVGDKIMVKFTRQGEKKDAEVTLGARTVKGGPGGGVGFGPGGPKPGRPYHAYYGGQKENVQNEQGPDSHEYGGVYRSDDGGDSWKRLNSVNPRPMYFSVVRVDPTDDKHLYVLGIALFRSQDGGKSFKPDGSKGVHADQ